MSLNIINDEKWVYISTFVIICKISFVFFYLAQFLEKISLLNTRIKYFLTTLFNFSELPFDNVNSSNKPLDESDSRTSSRWLDFFFQINVFFIWRQKCVKTPIGTRPRTIPFGRFSVSWKSTIGAVLDFPAPFSRSQMKVKSGEAGVIASAINLEWFKDR